MAVVHLEYCIKRAHINKSDIEFNQTLEGLNALNALAHENSQYDLFKLFSKLEFEWSWSNADELDNVSDIFEVDSDFVIALNKDNSKIRFLTLDDKIFMTAQVFFSLNLLRESNQEDLQDLIDENSLYFCGYVNGDWTYSIDDGCSLHVLGLTV